MMSDDYPDNDSERGLSPTNSIYSQLVSSSSRQEKSLGLLTQKFVALLQEAPDGILDLKNAANRLEVRQKRRIYDITNVLEGIGLIEKRSKNSIQWKGVTQSNQNSKEYGQRLFAMRGELEHLAELEDTLDEHRHCLQLSFSNILAEPCNAALSYVNYEEISRCYKDETLLAIQAPVGTELEVPLPSSGSSNNSDNSNPRRGKYQMRLSSHGGPIGVLLVNKDEQSRPAAVSVPPPPDPAQPGWESPKRAPRAAAKTSDASTHSVGPDGELLSVSEQNGAAETLVANEVFAPLLRLSPAPTGRDYMYNLDQQTEGATDLFDIPMQL